MPLVTRTSVQGNIFVQDTEPASWIDGDLWVDTSVNPPAVNVNDNGTATVVGELNATDNLTINAVTQTIRTWLFAS